MTLLQLLSLVDRGYAHTAPCSALDEYTLGQAQNLGYVRYSRRFSAYNLHVALTVRGFGKLYPAFSSGDGSV